MPLTRALVLYRPRLPGQRAQAIQVVHAAEALARRGVEVTLLADRGAPGASPSDALRALGLRAPAGLDLRIAPVAHSGLAGLWFRAELARWWGGPPGLVIARDKRRLAAALRRHGRGGHRILLETHELDSALAAEAGQDPAPWRALEAGLLPQLDGLITNCGGTLAAWEAAHDLGALPRVVAHNAVHPARLRQGLPVDPVARVVGSLAAAKGPGLLARAAPRSPLPIEVIGPVAPLPGLRVRPPLPYPEVPAALGTARVLLLPLGTGLFARALTSPLKLWELLATDRPIVAPDLPSLREAAAGAALHWHRPGDPDDLARAITDAAEAPPRAPRVRSWDDRLDGLGPLLGLR